MKSLAHAEFHLLALFSKIIPNLERPANLCSCSAWFPSPSKSGFLAKGDLNYCLFYDGPKECPRSIILSKVVKDHLFFAPASIY